MAVEAIEDGVQLVLQPAGLDEVAVGRGGGGEATGNPHPLSRELADHLPEGGVFAANLGDRLKAYRLERQDQLSHGSVATALMGAHPGSDRIGCWLLGGAPLPPLPSASGRCTTAAAWHWR